MPPGYRLILYGYDRDPKVTNAKVLYCAAQLSGVDSSTMSIQEKPTDTRPEAEEYFRSFGKNRKFVVVTNDM